MTSSTPNSSTKHTITAVEDQQSKNTHFEVSSLPSIKEVFSLAWKRLQLSWLNQLLTYLTMIGATFGIFVLIILSIVGTVGVSAINPDSIATLFNPAFLLGWGVVLLLIIYLSSALQAAYLKSVIAAEEEISYGQLIKSGFRVALPMLGTTLLLLLVILGGYGLLIIPGIIFAIFFSLSMYEVVAYDTFYLKALRNSYTIVTQNFGYFLKHILLWFGLGLLLLMLTAGDVNNGSTILVNLLNIIFQVFVINYFATVYVYARKNTDLTNPKSITGILIASLVGLVLSIIVTVFIVNNIMKMIGNGLENFNPNFDYELNDTNPEANNFENSQFDQLLEEELSEEEMQQYQNLLENLESMEEESSVN